jgi:RNA polymerase sigma-70 factor (ECF subfamily)
MRYLPNQLPPHQGRKSKDSRTTFNCEVTEQELIQQTKAGQTQAFAVLYEAHKARIFSICLRMLHERSLAEDVTQDVFLCAFRRMNSFRGDCAFATWLHSIAVNCVLMQFRRRKTRISDQLPIDHMDNVADNPCERIRADDRELAGSINRIALIDAINQLPPGYLITFLLVDVEGYTHMEVAGMLGCSTGNTKSQLHKARLKLRRLLAGSIRHAEVLGRSYKSTGLRSLNADELSLTIKPLLTRSHTPLNSIQGS